jgi:endoribonuclease Dicer
LDFGWSLADVLKKSRENVKNNDQDKDKKGTGGKVELASIEETEEEPELKERSGIDVVMEEEKKLSSDWMEIGTWSNDMANHDPISVCIPSHTFYECISVMIIA